LNNYYKTDTEKLKRGSASSVGSFGQSDERYKLTSGFKKTSMD
jgi:hypothetical protein